VAPTISLDVDARLYLWRDADPTGVFGGRDEGVKVDELGQGVRRAIGNAGDDAPAVTVANKDDVAQVLVEQDVDHVLDVGLEVDTSVTEVGSFAEASESSGENGVASGAQLRDDEAVP
jgi:hypothetical protein